MAVAHCIVNVIVISLVAPGLAINFGHIRGSHVVNQDSNDGTTTFAEFVKQHHRRYQPGSTEYEIRRILFQEQVQAVQKQNSNPDALWLAKVNKLADWTEAELRMLRGWNGAVRPSGAGGALIGSSIGLAQSTLSSEALVNQTSLPQCVSWTHLDALQRDNVQDQAACGSCWAFAAAKTLQTHSEIYQEKRTFSVEQILSCTSNPRHCGGDGGCKGATAELAFEYVLGVGAETEEHIPYAALDAECKTGKYHDAGPYSASLFSEDGHEVHSASGADFGGAAFGMTGWMKLKENSLHAVKSALVHHGPIAVGVSAAYSWNLYYSGILSDEGCPKDAVIDHAVTLVGYGVDEGSALEAIKYWHLMNSWGPDWGEHGFIRILMHDDEESHCGMDNNPQAGSACEGENTPVRVCGQCGILYDTSLPTFAGTGAEAKAKALQC